ncbi:hypothetical protein KM043_008620 [Ampulex compressa]|nr:hypothetical protein KM043_008620 [Ampulex compressa]
MEENTEESVLAAANQRYDPSDNSGNIRPWRVRGGKREEREEGEKGAEKERALEGRWKMLVEVADAGAATEKEGPPDYLHHRGRDYFKDEYAPASQIKEERPRAAGVLGQAGPRLRRSRASWRPAFKSKFRTLPDVSFKPSCL